MRYVVKTFKADEKKTLASEVSYPSRAEAAKALPRTGILRIDRDRERRSYSVFLSNPGK